MNLKEYQKKEKINDNIFWQLSTGEHQALLNEAIEEIIEFGIWLTGHDRKTIIEMYRDWQRSKEING